MVVIDCPKCGGIHYGEWGCPVTVEDVHRMIDQLVNRVMDSSKTPCPCPENRCELLHGGLESDQYCCKLGGGQRN